MIQVSIEMAEAIRADSDNALSCHIYNVESGKHIVGFGWQGGEEDNVIVGNPVLSAASVDDSLTEVTVEVTCSQAFDYELVVTK